MIHAFGWRFDVFPPMALNSGGAADLHLVLFGILVLTSFLYLGYLKALMRFSSDGVKTIPMIPFQSYNMIIVIVSIIAVSVPEKIPFTPVPILLSLIYLVLGICAAAAGTWLILKKEFNITVSFFQYAKTQVWVNFLMSGYILMLIVFSAIPLFNLKSKEFYLAMPFLMLIAYWKMNTAMFPGLFKLLRLNVEPHLIPADVKTKFSLVRELVSEQGKQEVFIAQEGLYNAFAVYPDKIIIGIDILKQLTLDEVKAVLLHEIGHLQDKKYLRQIVRNAKAGSMFLFAAAILGHLGTLPVVYILYTACFFIALYLFSSKGARLRAEYIADKYVKDFDENLFTHHITALVKIRKLNAVDENYCKKNDAAHLDLDERIQMVSENQYSKRISPKNRYGKIARYAGIFIAVVILSASITIVYEYIHDRYFLSPEAEWSKLHKEFHKQQEANQYAKAVDAIDKARQLSIKNFGENHKKTYICLNDLTEIHLAHGQWDKAAYTGQQAFQVGQKLYGEHDVQSVRSIKNLARLNQYQQQYDKARLYYQKALQTQNNLKDDEGEIADTLYQLAAVMNHDDDKSESAKYYQKIFSLFDQSGDKPNELYFAAVRNLSQIMAQKGRYAEAEKYLQSALRRAKGHYGEHSEEYAYALADVGLLYYQKKDYGSAEKYYMHGFGILKELYRDANAVYLNSMTQLGRIYMAQKRYGLAEEILLKALSISEKEWGQTSADVAYVLYDLAKVKEKQGNLPKALEYFQRIIVIADNADDMDVEVREVAYKKSISILSGQGKMDRVREIKGKYGKLQDH